MVAKAAIGLKGLNYVIIIIMAHLICSSLKRTEFTKPSVLHIVELAP